MSKGLFYVSLFWFVTLSALSAQKNQNADAVLAQLKSVVQQQQNKLVSASQHDDLLKKIKSLPSGTVYSQEWFRNFYLYGENLFKGGQFSYSAEVARECETRAKSAGNSDFQVFSLVLMAEIQIRNHILDSAFIYSTRAKDAVGKNPNEDVKMCLLALKADMADEQNKLYEALQDYRVVYDYYGKKGYDLNQAFAGINIANIYYRLKDYHAAIKMLKENLNYLSSRKHYLNIPANLINLGVYYSRIDSFAQSEKAYSEALRYARDRQDTFTMAQTFSNLGVIKRKSGDLITAELYHDSAYALCQQYNLPFGIFVNYINRAELLVSQKKWSEAIASLDKATEFKEFYSNLEYKVEIQDIYYRAYEAIGKTREALVALKTYKQLQDSLSKLESSSRLTELDNLYQKEKTSRELAEWKEKDAVQKLRNRVLYFILSLVILGLFFILNRLRTRRKIDAMRQQLTEEENQRLQLTIKTKDGELLAQAVHQASIRELAESMKTNLNKMSVLASRQQRAEIESLLEDIQHRIEGEQWADFEGRFAETYQDFYDTLLSLGPELTPTELKVCGFLRLNMSSKEIALLTHKSVSTIDNNRSTIRRKLNLPQDTNLTTFLESL